MASRIVIVGGGLSGLAVAYRLRQRQPDLAVTVLEKAPRIGGNIQTLERDGFRIECGPNGIFDAKPHTLDLCRDLGLGGRLIAGSEAARKNRYLFRNGGLQALPGSLWSFIKSPVLSWRAKWALLTEKSRRSKPDSPDESVAEFARRRTHREVADVLADAFVTGIHAGDPELLSAAAAFPRLVQFERDHGSVMRGFRSASRVRRAAAAARGEKPQPARLWSFREGLQVLIDALRSRLGDSIVTGVPVRRLEQTPDCWHVHGDGQDAWPADAVILTAHAHEQAGMLQDVDPVLAGEVAGIPYNRIAVVVVGYRKADVPRPFDGFGYIAPQNTRRDVLGVQWCSSIYPDRSPPGMVLWRALCGGWHRGEMVDWPDERLLAAVREELRLVHGVTTSPAIVHVVRWPTAIPQYVVGHLDRVARIERQVDRHRGLFLAGNAYHGVAMNDCSEQAVRLADRVTEFLAKPRATR